MRLIQSVDEASQMVGHINLAYKYDPNLVLGLDCEGLVKGRPLSLIQISVGDDVYVIDLFYVNPFALGLKEVMESPYIIKVFHDFWEDAAAIVNNYGVYCQRVYDTQIAHRLLSEFSQQADEPRDYSQNNVGLNELLKRYLNRTNTCKDTIQSKMKDNKYFWDTRPLTEEMIKYAGQDVLYLPYLYRMSWFLFDKMGIQMPDIYAEASKCNSYAIMNNDVQAIKKGDVVQAFIKNIQDFGVFCSLNIGLQGFVSHKPSKNCIIENYRIGDIIEVIIIKIDEKSQRVSLKLYESDYDQGYGEYAADESNYEYDYQEDYPENYEYNSYQEYPEMSYYDQYSQHLEFDFKNDLQLEYTQPPAYDNGLQNYSEKYGEFISYSPDMNSQNMMNQKQGKLYKGSPEFK